MKITVGTRVGEHEVLELLGEGGMGTVYKVRHLLSDRLEAMKVLRPELLADQHLVDRFRREIKVMASLTHTSIAAFYTAQRVGDHFVMFIEFVEGISLDTKLKTGRLNLDETLDYCCQALDALAYAHEKGVIHRDIKPGNIMVSSKGLIKLMDFGIAKAIFTPELTQSGTTLGSLYYMSPEQVLGHRLDHRADLYSLGITLYEMLTGQKPFDGASEWEILNAHVNIPPVPPTTLDSSLPPSLDDKILKALAKNPAARFQSALEFRAVLKQVRAETQFHNTISRNRLHNFFLNKRPRATEHSHSILASLLIGKYPHRLWLSCGIGLTILILLAVAIQINIPYSTRSQEVSTAYPERSVIGRHALSSQEQPQQHDSALELLTSESPIGLPATASAINQSEHSSIPYPLDNSPDEKRSKRIPISPETTKAISSQRQTPNDTKPTLFFEVHPKRIAPGETAVLKWEVEGAGKVFLEPEIGEVGLRGTLNVQPSGSLTYHLRAIVHDTITVATASVVVDESTPRRAIRLPAGTPVPVRLIDAINSSTAQEGESFRASLADSVSIANHVVLPKDAIVLGRIENIKEAGRVTGRTQLTLLLYEIQADAVTYTIFTRPITIYADSSVQDDLTRTAVISGVGAAAGAVLGGASGAVKGAGIGAVAGGSLAFVSKGEEIDLRPELTITFQLAQSLTVAVTK